MEIGRVVFVSLCASATALHAAAPLPSDVTRFISQREGCETLSGEDPSMMETREAVEEWIRTTNKVCDGLDKRLINLRKKYVRRPAVIKALSSFEPLDQVDR